MECFSKQHSGGAHKLLSLCLDVQCPTQELYCLTKRKHRGTSTEPKCGGTTIEPRSVEPVQKPIEQHTDNVRLKFQSFKRKHVAILGSNVWGFIFPIQLIN